MIIKDCLIGQVIMYFLVVFVFVSPMVDFEDKIEFKVARYREEKDDYRLLISV
jgi:hypothetical protein